MKRKIFAVCMVMALLLSCMFAVPAQAASAFPVAKGDRMVLNGDFSEGSEGWVIPAEGQGGIMEEGGNKFARMTAKTDLVSPSINVTSGETITWEFDYRSFETTSNTLGWRFSVFYITEDGEDSAGSPPHHVSYMDIQPNWKRASYACKVPNGMVRASFRINCYSMNSEAYIDIDNVIAVWKPTLNEAVYNGNMEVVQDNMPKGYTASGNNVTIEKVNTHSGKTAIKITNTEDTVSYVSTQVYINRIDTNPNKTATNFSAYMNLTDFEDDASDDADGVRLEVYYGPTLKHNTGWFTKTAYKDGTPMGWRKMMQYEDYTRTSGLVEMRVTLNGKGTVYVDDFYTEPAKNIIENGDFEGFRTDYQPAVWRISQGLKWGEDANAAVIREPGTDNHYLKLINMGSTSSNGVYHNMDYQDTTLVTVGEHYKLSLDARGSNYDCSIRMQYAGFNFANNSGIGATSADGTEWFRDFTVYFKAAVQKDNYYLCDRNITPSNPTVGTCFDNIKVEPVVCETAFYDANGNKVAKAENGKAYTAKYVGYGKNYSTTSESAPVSLIYALYEKMEDGSVRLASVKFEKGIAKYVEMVPQSSLVASGAITKFGYVPLELTSDSAITIPNDGKSYELRAYTWDDFTNMTPYYASISA